MRSEKTDSDPLKRKLVFKGIVRGRGAEANEQSSSKKSAWRRLKFSAKPLQNCEGSLLFSLNHGITQTAKSNIHVYIFN